MSKSPIDSVKVLHTDIAQVGHAEIISIVRVGKRTRTYEASTASAKRLRRAIRECMISNWSLPAGQGWQANLYIDWSAK